MSKKTVKELYASLAEMSNPDTGMAAPPEKLLDKHDLIQLFNISERTLYNWRDKLVLPFVKIQGKIYFKLSDVSRLLKTGSVA